MQQINSTRDFEAMLHAERAVVFIGFEWSGRSKRAHEVFTQWQKQAQHNAGQAHPAVYELLPDSQPETWKWVDESIGAEADGEPGYGAIVWLRKGAVVALIKDAAKAGVKMLARVTEECFVRGKTLTTATMAALQNEPVPLDLELLKILCCPETHQALALAEASVLEKLNARFATGHLKNRGGQPVLERIEDGLVRADGRYLYPMRRNIPILLVDEAIPVAR